ncbi:MAG TPA: energy transducer TonB, partial [Methylophilaceae bacterium]|nr:energy transducer TonB [Methylophilaceae bacterium]
MLAFIIPNFKFDPIKTLHQELKIEIVNPKQPEPAPAVIPELPKPVTSQPEPVKPKPVPQKIKP